MTVFLDLRKYLESECVRFLIVGAGLAAIATEVSGGLKVAAARRAESFLRFQTYAAVCLPFHNQGRNQEGY